MFALFALFDNYLIMKDGVATEAGVTVGGEDIDLMAGTIGRY